ncbi:AAA family ATPase [Neomoorella mulderi]|uniref:Chromosome partition protein Smc n=1 Tax=Moorella mulderi DSM 14980 TaxID=1122241 RepID=A0A151ATT4_9FIRM|nr:AAA family ATPase [Moorella mulderi]KYH30950.1 chromosome partition protein Smc [Moorella mulderi DSM 14980]
MPAVTWQRLSLAGFGCYRERVTVTFQEGLNVLVAPNEKGKSTLIAGLEAVLFGLPNTSNPEAFGSARFANREEPDQFEGEVEFRVDGRAYALRRLFNTNRVTIRTRGDHGWEEVWRGSHNPGAHKKIPAYLEHLTAFLGITSRELFEATFCLGQPLPEGRALSNEVQKLLSGSGGHYQEALKILADDLRALTRYCGDRGVGNNGRKDARLEELQAEIAILRQQQQATSTTIDQLTAVRSRLQELAVEIKSVRAQLKKKQDLRAAWDGWRALQVRYNSALHEQQQAGAVQERARELEQKIRLHKEQATRSYPEWASAPASTARKLDRLVELEQEMARLKGEMANWEAHLRDLNKEQEALAARLQGELAAVANHPDILRDLEDLRSLVAARQELAREVKDLAARAGETAAELAALPDFSLLGSGPAMALEGLQVAARQLLEGWGRFQEQQARCKELEAELAGDLSCFAGMPPEKEALVASYATTRLTLAREEEAAREACRRLEEQKATYRRREEDFQREFGDLASLGEEAFQAAIDKPRLLADLQAKEAARKAALEAGRRKRLGIVLALTGAGLVTGLVTGLATGSWLVALVVALVLAGLGYGAGTYLGREGKDSLELAGEIATLREHLEQLDAVLGPWAGATAAELGELRQRLRERGRARAELATLAASLPGAAEEEAARLALEAATRASRDFLATTAEISARFTDVTAAYRRYLATREERERLAAEMEAFTVKAVGAPPLTALTIPLAGLAAPWPGLTSLARLAGQAPATVGELLTWLKELDQAAWEDFLARARRWEELTALNRQVQEKREQLLQPDEEGQTALERLAARIAALEGHVAPFTVATEAGEIAPLLEEAARIKERLGQVAGRQQAAGSRVKDLRGQIQELELEAKGLREDLAVILAPAGGEAGKALERRQAYEQLAREWQGWQEQLAGLLGEGDLDDLAAACLDAANRAAAILKEWQDLVREHPGLPEPGRETKGEELEEQYRALRAGIKELENRLEGLEGEERELLRRQSQLEGNQTANMAIVAETLAAREKELERLELEAGALALAYRELVAAARDYSQNYRRELALAASRYFTLFTGRRARQVEITEDFQVEVREGGAAIALAQLSRGAQDQLYLALRLAIGDLLSADLTLPFIFDDCFVNCDGERRERIRESLAALAQQRQLILLSHDPDFAAWGTPVKIER